MISTGSELLISTRLLQIAPRWSLDAQDVPNMGHGPWATICRKRLVCVLENQENKVV